MEGPLLPGDSRRGGPYSGQHYSGQHCSGQHYLGQHCSGQHHSGQHYSGQHCFGHSGRPAPDTGIRAEVGSLHAAAICCRALWPSMNLPPPPPRVYPLAHGSWARGSTVLWRALRWQVQGAREGGRDGRQLLAALPRAEAGDDDPGRHAASLFVFQLCLIAADAACSGNRVGVEQCVQARFTYPKTIKKNFVRA